MAADLCFDKTTIDFQLGHYKPSSKPSKSTNGLVGTGFVAYYCRSLMVRWVVGSILHEVDPLSYFSFQPVLHDWCNKGRGMCYPVCGMVHIKEPLLLIKKNSPCGGSGFPLSLYVVIYHMSDAI